jgi:hypothetical protein
MLKLNDDKTEFLCIFSKSKLPPAIPAIKIGNDLIPTSNSARNLGVIFDQHAVLDNHISSVIRSSWNWINKIGKIRKYITQPCAATIVHAFITSKLDYCNSLYYGLPIQQVQRLQYLQNTAARIVTLSCKFDHITPILRNLHWLPVKYRIEFKILLLTFKSLNNMAPKYLSELLERQTSNGYSLRSSQDTLRLKETMIKSVRYGDRAFSIAAPKLWNGLDKSIRSSETTSAFKSKLKTYLFKLAYDLA